MTLRYRAPTPCLMDKNNEYSGVFKANTKSSDEVRCRGGGRGVCQIVTRLCWLCCNRHFSPTFPLHSPLPRNSNHQNKSLPQLKPRKSQSTFILSVGCDAGGEPHWSVNATVAGRDGGSAHSWRVTHQDVLSTCLRNGLGPWDTLAVQVACFVQKVVLDFL